jgi:putative addiction module component (TIGR02574 family)
LGLPCHPKQRSDSKLTGSTEGVQHQVPVSLAGEYTFLLDSISPPGLSWWGKPLGDTEMTETAEKLKIELSRLSIQERADVAYFLIHSLDEDIDYNVESAWDVELTRRLQEIHNGTASSELSSKVFSQLKEKFS